MRKSGLQTGQLKAGKAGIENTGPVATPPSDMPRKSTPAEIAAALERAVGFTARTFQSYAGTLAYKLYVPARRTIDDPALVMMLHGCTQDPDDFARGTGMNALAEEFGLIVAYPLQPRTANPQGCWNWYEGRNQRRGAGEPAMLSGLAQDLAREFGVGGNRIFVAGLSAGGAMADVLASTYPEVFSAAGIHSGLPCGAASTMLSAFAVMKAGPLKVPRARIARNPMVRKIIFHGDADRTVNAVNGRQIFEGSRSRQANAAEIIDDAAINGRQVTRTIVDSPDGGSLLEHWVVHGAGHAWTGGKTGGSFVDTKGPDASREMIRFFLRN